MNIYDFNKVIYNGNLLLDFYLFILRKHFIEAITLSFKLIFKFIGYIFGKYTLSELNSFIYSYLYYTSDVETLISQFHNKYKNKINNTDLTNNDLIISNLPDYLLVPFLAHFPSKYICTNFDKSSKQVSKYFDENITNLSNNYNNYYANTNYNIEISKKCKKTYVLHVELSKYTPSLKTKLFKTFFDKSFILFLFVGVINTFNGIIFSSLYSIAFQANIAFIFGYITSLTISYLLNSLITFREKLSFNKYIKFCISYIPNFIIQNLIVFIVYNTLHLHKLIAYLLAAIIGIPVTFILMKIFAFNSKKETTA